MTIVVGRLSGVCGSPPKLRARCPAHDGTRATLAIREAEDGRVLLTCHKHCTVDAIVHAVGLSVGDLFPARSDDWKRERDATRRAYRETPRMAIKNALKVELARTRERLRAQCGFERPLRASDLNAVRQRVAAIYEIDLAPLAPFDWETPGFDDDPNWPTLYMTALEEEVRRRWHALHPDSQAWESDPNGPGIYDRMRAELVARTWLRGMA